MPCKSWSLQAVDTCPGAKAKGGGLVAACQGCYARGGTYRFPNVKAPRIANREDWKRDAWVADMVAAIGRDTHFRWFDSGDCYAVGLANKIYQVMKQTPGCQHWLPTRMHKFPKFKKVFGRMHKLANVVVRYSSDSIDGATVRGKTTSTIFSNSAQLKANVTVCRAYRQDGKCLDCRACWNSDNKVIGYPAHGQSMLKLIATQAA